MGKLDQGSNWSGFHSLMGAQEGVWTQCPLYRAPPARGRACCVALRSGGALFECSCCLTRDFRLECPSMTRRITCPGGGCRPRSWGSVSTDVAQSPTPGSLQVQPCLCCNTGLSLCSPCDHCPRPGKYRRGPAQGRLAGTYGRSSGSAEDAPGPEITGQRN